MDAKLKTVHIMLTPQIAALLEAEVTSGRFANLSEAVRNAAWKALRKTPPRNCELLSANSMSHRPKPRRTALLSRLKFATGALGGESYRHCVSNDQDLLKLVKPFGIEIGRPAQFIARHKL